MLNEWSPLKSKQMFDKRVHVRLSDATRRELEHTSSSTGKTVSQSIRNAIDVFTGHVGPKHAIEQDYWLEISSQKAYTETEHAQRYKYQMWFLLEDWLLLQLKDYANKYTGGNQTDAIRAAVEWYIATIKFADSRNSTHH